ncbi:MAG TPA: hypothetical protein VNW04_15945 [Puia sp.]|nr:hypothetical protein [Puia sp.]
MNHLIDTYYSSVLNSVVKLTGLPSEEELKALTEEILEELRRREEEFTAFGRKGVFVYRVVLVHVFSFLEARKDTQRIEFLRKILLIHPSYYLRLPDK